MSTRFEEQKIQEGELPETADVGRGDYLTPRQVVSELDKYIIGQDEAKKKVAIALRNRWRRRRLPEDLRDEVAPKNIIMIGPTGVGKTEIARRLARLAHSPFIKVEASKFTEVGYVGRDVDSMIRDLVELSIGMVRQERSGEVRQEAEEFAEDRLLDLLLPPARPSSDRSETAVAVPGEQVETTGEPSDSAFRTREKFREKLRAGKLEDRYVELEVTLPTPSVVSIGPSLEEMGVNFQEIFDRMMPPRTKRRKAKIREAREILIQEETQKLIDMDEVASLALERAENHGIIFLDEIDKVASSGPKHGPDVSREGVQRDILPIIEGSTVMTRYGPVKTDHMLFIAAGAFHMSKPSDLIPELQGRFPIRVELDSLEASDFRRILTEPKNSLVRQYVGLLSTEDVTLEFTEDALEEIAQSAAKANEELENIGARRLHTIMEQVLEEVSFGAPDDSIREVTIDAEYVREKVQKILENRDLSRYIL